MHRPLSDTEQVSMLEAMQLIRRHEERLAELQAAGRAAGTCTAVGQEAAAVGVVHALGADDLILTNHRSAGHLLARGADPGRLIAEILGRSTGYCKGKSGSLHVSARELGIVLTSTIVGGELSLAPGVALAQRMQGRPGVVACFFGDGAACEGIFHEALNLAVVWKLPVLFVCENNQWQAYVHRKETMPQDHVRPWAAAHGLPAVVVDGNDVEAVHAAARHAVDTIRVQGGPCFIEAVTYRLRGHFEPDDQGYVDADELTAWKSRDPIQLLARRLIDRGVLSEGEWAHVRQRVEATLDAAFAFAEASPFPSADELITDVYA
ncbi:thiamine pyrophosphate-dependent dehydrogenase E1 component subunit alpha [Caldimonas aquatica]|uniref:Thiamine pyrophosphate-dependent dehydrogenase E1 component subunit alpha n=1 Tax=Caldimonas aquatica TaxID=376175 RepID=A0ABY6MUU9_9BURK|nr:thiamine pyrophosphate-dependent dehydrogenase E1 component subunit alpha [Schlegelella aquatica]UZD55798.1 thiamine pyrophosphate-dependent dehydrogenase E1 component subunit alpha [Schlegelella aquatica]